MLNVSLIAGPVPVAILVVGLVAVAALLARRGRRWWWRAVPLAVAIGALCAAVVAVAVNVVWRPFPDPLPARSLVWTALGVAAVALAVLRIRSAPRPRTVRARVLPVVAAATVVITGIAQVNQLYGAYPTLRAALGLRLAQQVDLGQLAPPKARAIVAPPGTSLAGVWRPPPGMPSRGAVSETPIPGVVSGFPARPAWVYLPPAYLATPRAQLPVLVLLPGQPGAPRDWLDGGRLIETMDAYARAHAGLAPVVVVPDPLGSRLAQPLCVDGPRGRAFTYLTVDVPAWIKNSLQVDRDAARWAVAGNSAGGTCAMQLAVNAPSVYPTFVDMSGQEEPTLGTRQRTINDVFGGDAAAFQRVNPLDVLASGRLRGAGLAGAVTVGGQDTRYGPQARRVYQALRAGGVDARYLEVPGGHSWQVWSEALRLTMPFVAARTGLTAR